MLKIGDAILKSANCIKHTLTERGKNLGLPKYVYFSASIDP